jgi:hypothetical protein
MTGNPHRLTEPTLSTPSPQNRTAFSALFFSISIVPPIQADIYRRQKKKARIILERRPASIPSVTERIVPEKIALLLFRFYFVNLPPYNTLTDNNRFLCELK